MDVSLLPSPPYVERIDRLVSSLNDCEYDSLLITSDVNVRYLIGFEGEGSLLCTPGGLFLLTDSRYSEYANELLEGWPFRVSITVGRGESGFRLLSAAAGRANIGIEAEHVTMHDYAMLTRAFSTSRLFSSTRIVEDMRLIKDPSELARIALACDIADNAFSLLLEQFRPGWTEKQVARILDATMRELGADESAFQTIVASGPNSAKPHAIPSDREILTSETVVLDFGACVDGYRSDMTRTVWFDQLSARDADIYSSVLEANRLGVAALEPGKTYAAIDAVCRGYLEDQGLAQHFTHSTGHNLGLEIHEIPYLSSIYPGIRLVDNQAITIEPGVYVNGRSGVRVEDTLVVGKPSVTLTKAEKLDVHSGL